MSLVRIHVSADQDYLDAAIAELREVFPDATFAPEGPDLFFIEGDGVSIATVAAACRDREHPLAFPRHLMRGAGTLPLPATVDDLDGMLDAALAQWQEVALPDVVSLQAWSSGSDHPNLPVRMDELWHLLADTLSDEGIEVMRAGCDHVLSACVTAEAIVLGSNRSDNALSDWPGGRVRLAKPKGQISRSEFKLEELLRTYDLPLPEGVALDLGASPGGWTRILRQRGLMVWAVDPGDLDPRVAGDPGVRHLRTTAGAFFHDSDRTFDLIVNDMRMTPALSAELMLTASGHLNPGGVIILTLKISPHHARDVVRNALQVLRGRYDIDLVRQLHHNRNEVTVVAHRPG